MSRAGGGGRCAAAVLLASALAGCGRGAVPDGAAGVTHVRLMARSHLSMAPFLIADEEGYFEAHGLEVEFVSLSSSREGLPALIKGELDVLASSLVPSYLHAIAEGAELRIVADKGHLGSDGCTYLAFLTRPELLEGGELRLPPGAERWRFSLRRGSFYEFMMERALEDAGIGAELIELLHLPAATEAQALMQGRIDVCSAAGSSMERALLSGGVTVWRPAQSVLPDFQFAVLVYGPSFLVDDPRAGERFMIAYLQGVRQYGRGKTARNLEILERRTGLDRELLREACWIPMRTDGRINVGSIEALQTWARAAGYLERPVAADEFWEPRFVEAAALRLAGGDRREG